MKNEGAIIGWFIGLVALQVLVLNHVQLAYLINPFAYIYLIMVIPNRRSRTATVVTGFLLGLAIDALSSSWGIHTVATTFIAFIQHDLLRLLAQPEQIEKDSPSIDSMGVTFVFYAVVLIFIHHLILFSLEAFSFRLVLAVLLKTLVSSALTLVIVLVFDRIRYSHAHGVR